MKSGTPNMRTARLYSSPRKAMKWRADVLDLTGDVAMALAASSARANLLSRTSTKSRYVKIVPVERLPKLYCAIETPVAGDCLLQASVAYPAVRRLAAQSTTELFPDDRRTRWFLWRLTDPDACTPNASCAGEKAWLSATFPAPTRRSQATNF